MKLAWLCYSYDYEEDNDLPVIQFEDPYRVSFKYRKIVPIVYAILEVDNDE